MKNSDDRANVNFLLSADPDEFVDLFEALQAHFSLCDAIEDLKFQLEDVPVSKFQGSNYENWKMGASYKKNKVCAAERRFRARVRELSYQRYGLSNNL